MKAAVLALLVVLLAACEGFPERFDLAGDGADGEGEPLPAVEEAEEPAEDRAEETAGPPPMPPRPAAKPARPEIEGDELIGLTTAETWELLAAPTTTKKESPATVWTYEYAGCRLELFFYFDLESQEQRTLAYDLDAGPDMMGAETFCLQEFALRGGTLDAPDAAPASGAESAAAGDEESASEGAEQGARTTTAGTGTAAGNASGAGDGATSEASEESTE